MKLAIHFDCDQTNSAFIENLKTFINSEYVFFFQAWKTWLLRTPIAKQQYKWYFLNVIIFAIIISVYVITKIYLVDIVYRKIVILNNKYNSIASFNYNCFYLAIYCIHQIKNWKVLASLGQREMRNATFSAAAEHAARLRVIVPHCSRCQIKVLR